MKFRRKKTLFKTCHFNRKIKTGGGNVVGEIVKLQRGFKQSSNISRLLEYVVIVVSSLNIFTH